MSKIVRLHGFGRPEHLRIDEVLTQQPGPGEVRLRVEAANQSQTYRVCQALGQALEEDSLNAPSSELAHQ